MTTTREDPNRLAVRIVAFCRFARSHGLPVGMHQTLAALQVADVIGVNDWQRLSFALRAVLCSSREEWEQFDQLFDDFWNSARNQSDSQREPSTRKLTRKRSPDSRLLISAEGGDAGSRDNEGKLVSGASSQQRLKRVDFSEASQTDLAALEKLSLRLLQADEHAALSQNEDRRRIRSRRPAPLDSPQHLARRRSLYAGFQKQEKARKRDW